MNLDLTVHLERDDSPTKAFVDTTPVGWWVCPNGSTYASLRVGSDWRGPRVTIMGDPDVVRAWLARSLAELERLSPSAPGPVDDLCLPPTPNPSPAQVRAENARSIADGVHLGSVAS